ncbi:MAG: DNA mismatch repair endonuclease MutL [Gammaproteobacteria bacterium]|nr:MAG: DNA mismatch repair endonuclease MutL [Gammaproteobacteria bacterium]
MTTQVPRIGRLPPLVANQIAAGEVVERPASVLKELVENSLDAQASRIDIVVDAGGKQKIQVTDDGHGIHPDDLQLALTRHATSKIRTTKDLMHIGSLGFRGEALASIASVARVTLRSRIEGSDKAWQVQVAGSGQLPPLVPASGPKGTTVIVQDLFFNTPARRHFLRAERTEFLHVQDTVIRLALSHPHVAFSLTHNGRAIWQLPAAHSPTAETLRIQRLLGRKFVEASHDFEVAHHKWLLSGRVAGAAFHRNQTDMQYFFVNGRPVRDRMLMHAMREAYQDLLPTGRAPAYIVYLVVPADEVDVNVHPTKHEVRFQQSRDIHDFIVQAIRNTLVSDHDSVNANMTVTAVPAKQATVSAPVSRRVRVQEQVPDYGPSLWQALTKAPHEQSHLWWRQAHFWIGEWQHQLYIVDAARIWSSANRLLTEIRHTTRLLLPWRWPLRPEEQQTIARLGCEMLYDDETNEWTLLSVPSLCAGLDESMARALMFGQPPESERPPEAWLDSGCAFVASWLTQMSKADRVVCARPLTTKGLQRLFEGGL